MADESRAIRISICIPNEGHTQVEAYANRLENFLHLGKLQERGRLENLTPRFEFLFLTLGRILTPLAREEAVNFTLDQNCDYLYMIDDDMTVPNDCFERLFAHDVDVIAPLAFSRNYPHNAVLYDVKSGWDPMSRSNYYINHHIDRYPKNQLVECDAVGFGSVLIKRKVLDGIAKPRFMSTSPTGEDILFCTKAKKAGFRVFMDTSIKLGHLSHPIEVSEAYVEKVRKEFGYKTDNPLQSQYQRKIIEPGVLLGN